MMWIIFRIKLYHRWLKFKIFETSTAECKISQGYKTFIVAQRFNFTRRTVTTLAPLKRMIGILSAESALETPCFHVQLFWLVKEKPLPNNSELK